ncbi:MAG TPA: 5-formyltetrahydrofolate cyclo-ligase [Terrimicrobiaceae bacterium]|nr:5-formyltetrahydrofolate cyclo-ligase [Terrimicrobiaceae bacterium]
MISGEKQTLRAKMKAMVRDFPEKALASQKIRRHLCEFPVFATAQMVFGFLPLRGEPDWLGEEFPADKLIAYPRIDGDEMQFVFSVDFEVGGHGVREPVGGTVAEAPDVVLVPGLAFDATGARLGRGKGFYDRWLAANPTSRSIGLCFKCQLLAGLPFEAHDARVGAIVTEDGILVP